MVKQRKGTKEELIVPIKSVEPKTNTPTPEQMRIAQILEKKVVDSTIKIKLKQIMDATQRSADEVYVALHDSDFDVNRAVDLLIEGQDQMADWCTNEKRKKKLADLKEKKEEVEVDEKKESFRGRGDGKRPGRKINGRQEPRKQTAERGKGKRPSSSGFGSMVFERSNPPPIDPGCLPPVRNQWEKPFLRTNPEDDWDCEEFQGSLSQTQIFTSSKKHEPEADKTPVSSFAEEERQERPIVIPALKDRPRDYLYRLNLKEDKRPPSKIPTLPVEMPPDLRPSFSFLDIQFGAMDLCASETSSEPQSSAPSKNPSVTTLASLPSSGSVTHLANTSISSTSTNNVATTPMCTMSSTGMNGFDTAGDNLNSITNTNLTKPETIPINLPPPSSISNSITHLMQQAGTTPPNTVNVMNQYGSNQRFNQPFNNLQYGIINTPYESRESPHLPPFKSPPGVPKTPMVPPLPPASLMSNQYIVGQGNVPYFPHPPIYYYEEVPPVINSQQRLANMPSHPHHFDVAYQTAPSSRDSVHYNV